MQSHPITPDQAKPGRAKPDQAKRGNPQPLHAAQIDGALLNLRNASAVVGLSIPTLYRRAKTDPTFPKLVRLGTRCTRIRAGDLAQWAAGLTGG